jgi:C4-dicarboxylate transporter DctQ subunit
MAGPAVPAAGFPQCDPGWGILNFVCGQRGGAVSPRILGLPAAGLENWPALTLEAEVFLRILDRLEEILIASLIAAATLLIFVAVVQRYALGIPFLYPLVYEINLTWAQELCVYMFVWMAKFGAAYGVRTGIHVGVDVVVNMLEPPARKKVVLFGLLCGALFTSVVGTMGAKFVIELYPGRCRRHGATRWIIFLCVPLGS